jgi:hypothetical protein
MEMVSLGFLHHLFVEAHHFQMPVRVKVSELVMEEQVVVDLEQVIQQLELGDQATKECHL